ncbi:hypothetical protein D3C80_1685580 [compost metagenome]
MALAEFFQVFADREHGLVGAVGGGVEAHGRDLGGAGLLAAGVPPFQLDGRQAVLALGVDAVGHAVDALAAGEVATPIVQIADLRAFRVAAQTADVAQGRRGQRHGQGTVGL